MTKFFITALFICCFGFYGTAQTKIFEGGRTENKRLEAFLKAKMDSIGMPGLSIAVIRKGKIVFHKALGVANLQSGKKINDEAIFEAASLSKTAFAYFVMKQVDKGLLDLDKPLYKYMEYDDIAYDSRYKLITARMVLSHTAGFPNWRTTDFPDSSLNVKRGQLYLKFTPGTQFSYSGEGYYYLSQVIAVINKVDMKQLDSIFQREVAQPLGLQRCWFSYNDFIGLNKVTGYRNKKPILRWPGSLATQDSTKFGAAGGLHTEAVSYATLLIALMESKGFKNTTTDELFRSQIKLPLDEDHDGDTGWGLGVAVMEGPEKISYEHRGNNGNFQSYFWMDRKAGNGYVFFTNSDLAGELHEHLKNYLRLN
ncbi:serine hydrolase domain-containing protein [Pedobacter nototheniae]|uniref:serine hydrolase domain-containing protein n=1 Tax=Pedobacter nototheniae TaxID=2488994 RepID=UPI002931F465|nr:serine hydrolase domain-containing protein [Pedobacter nototheniae]